MNPAVGGQWSCSPESCNLVTSWFLGILAWWVFRWSTVGIQQLVLCVNLWAVKVAQCSCLSIACASCLRAHLVPGQPDSFLFLFVPPSVHADIALTFVTESQGSTCGYLLLLPVRLTPMRLRRGLLRGKVALAGHPHSHLYLIPCCRAGRKVQLNSFPVFYVFLIIRHGGQGMKYLFPECHQGERSPSDFCLRLCCYLVSEHAHLVGQHREMLLSD